MSEDTAVEKDIEKDIAAIKEDLAALKRDLSAAVATLSESARGTASDLAKDLSEEASALYREVADRGAQATEALSAKVEEQPITSVLLAFSFGYIFARLSR